MPNPKLLQEKETSLAQATEEEGGESNEEQKTETESYGEIIIRSFKIYLFVMALNVLGSRIRAIYYSLFTRYESTCYVLD